MSKNFKKMLSYYKPYRCIFWADMFFATVSAAVALAIPLVIRYVTYTLVYEDKAQIMFQIKIIAAALFAMVVGRLLQQVFYLELRPCDGSENRVQHACRDF